MTTNDVLRRTERDAEQRGGRRAARASDEAPHALASRHRRARPRRVNAAITTDVAREQGGSDDNDDNNDNDGSNDDDDGNDCNHGVDCNDDDNERIDCSDCCDDVCKAQSNRRFSMRDVGNCH